MIGARFENLDIEGFGYGIVLGNNHYLSSYQNIWLLNNGTNLSYPNASLNAGEGIQFIGGVWQQKGAVPNVTPVMATCADFEGATAINITFVGVSFDNCPLTLNTPNPGGLAHYVFTGTHFENPNGPLTLGGAKWNGDRLYHYRFQLWTVSGVARWRGYL